jgi:hypothetical protein
MSVCDDFRSQPQRSVKFNGPVVDDNLNEPSLPPSSYRRLWTWLLPSGKSKSSIDSSGHVSVTKSQSTAASSVSKMPLKMVRSISIAFRSNVDSVDTLMQSAEQSLRSDGDQLAPEVLQFWLSNDKSHVNVDNNENCCPATECKGEASAPTSTKKNGSKKKKRSKIGIQAKLWFRKGSKSLPAESTTNSSKDTDRVKSESSLNEFEANTGINSNSSVVTDDREPEDQLTELNSASVITRPELQDGQLRMPRIRPKSEFFQCNKPEMTRSQSRYSAIEVKICFFC